MLGTGGFLLMSAVLLWPLILLSLGVALRLRRLRWTPLSFIGWEAVPFLGTFAIFCMIGTLNWDYEAKLLRAAEMDGGTFGQIHCGQILLVLAIVFTLIAGGLLFALRLLAPRLFGAARRGPWWMLAVPLIILTAVTALAANAQIILGPAAQTMMEQMRSVPTPQRAGP